MLILIHLLNFNNDCDFFVCRPAETERLFFDNYLAFNFCFLFIFDLIIILFDYLAFSVFCFI